MTTARERRVPVARNQPETVTRGPRLLLLLMLLPGVMTPSSAFAYIGPGAGLGAIALTIALILGILLLFVGLVWYPLKRALRKRAAGDRQVSNDSDDKNPE